MARTVYQGGASIDENAEEWRDVAGFEGLYQVSNLGRLRSLDKVDRGKKKWAGKILKQRINARGYMRTCLCKNGEHINVRIHRLVAEAFIPNPDGKEQVNHIDGDKTNNAIGNLEWATCSENHAHAWATGLAKAHPNLTPVCGEDSKFSTLTTQEVLGIRGLRKEFGMTYDELARMYRVSKHAIYCVITGRTWKHLLKGV